MKLLVDMNLSPDWVCPLEASLISVYEPILIIN